MRLHIISDLHLEHCPDVFGLKPDVQADVVVLAGDIHKGTRGVEWAAVRFKDKPVIYVPGNHEFYGQKNIAHAIDVLRMAAKDTHVHVLDDDAVVIDGVRFIGSTLWTDFLLFGRNERAVAARREAALFMTDFRSIGQFKLREWDERHAKGRAFLNEQLAIEHAGPTVVVTHHAPHAGSVHADYADDPMTPAFVSHLPDLVGQADLWIHGHVHNSFDYEPHDCQGVRVVCNPRGYARRDKPRNIENSAFEPGLVVEVKGKSGKA